MFLFSRDFEAFGRCLRKCCESFQSYFISEKTLFSRAKMLTVFGLFMALFDHDRPQKMSACKVLQAGGESDLLAAR